MFRFFLSILLFHFFAMRYCFHDMSNSVFFANEKKKLEKNLKKKQAVFRVWFWDRDHWIRIWNVMKPTKNRFLCNVWKNKLCVVHFSIGHHYEAIVYVSFSQHIVSVWFSTARLNIIVPIFLRWFHVYWLRLCLSLCMCERVFVPFFFLFSSFFFLINYCFRCDCVCVCLCMYASRVGQSSNLKPNKSSRHWNHLHMVSY